MTRKIKNIYIWIFISEKNNIMLVNSDVSCSDLYIIGIPN